MQTVHSSLGILSRDMTDIQAKQLVDKIDLLIKLRLSQQNSASNYWSVRSDEKFIDELKPELVKLLMDAK